MSPVVYLYETLKIFSARYTKYIFLLIASLLTLLLVTLQLFYNHIRTLLCRLINKNDKDMIIEIISKEEFTEFKEELLTEIRELLSQRQTQLRWMKAKDVKKILPLSPATLQNLRINGSLPFTKVGGAIYYNIEDIERMMSEGKIDNQVPPPPKRGRKRNPSSI